jgi:hypothetical protein
MACRNNRSLRFRQFHPDRGIHNIMHYLETLFPDTQSSGQLVFPVRDTFTTCLLHSLGYGITKILLGNTTFTLTQPFQKYSHGIVRIVDAFGTIGFSGAITSIRW